MPYKLFILPEGKATVDSRAFDPGSMTWRDLLPLLWTPDNTGHEGAVTVGAFTGVRREDRDGVSWLVSDEIVWDTSPDAAEARRMVDEGILRSVSADTATAVERVEYNGRDGAVSWVEEGRLLGVTITPLQAFDDAEIVPDGEPDDEDRMDEGEPTVGLEDLGALIAAAEQAIQPAETIVAHAVHTVADDDWPIPPASWFATPEPDRDDPEVVWVDAEGNPTDDREQEGARPWGVPLTVTADGRVYGHLASWQDCHTGYEDRCVPPPKSATGYAWFHTGACETTEGQVPTGRITVGTGHAGHTASAADAVAHYDNTGHTVADVHAINGEMGPWLSGWLRPSATRQQKHELTASPPSGDWRPRGGSTELVGVLAVNVPGFPLPRLPRTVATFERGEFRSLVASGLPPRSQDVEGLEISSRVERLEAMLEAQALAASM